MAHFTDALDALMANAEGLMAELSRKDGTFTNYEFIRRVAQKNQGAYVNLLKSFLDARGEQYVFNLAHQEIGKQLSTRAQKAGYEQIKDSKKIDKNIWGDDEYAVVYKKK